MSKDTVKAILVNGVAPTIREFFHIPGGASLLAAIIVLSAMVLPSIIKLSFTALETAPGEYEEGSLGATPIETYYKVSIPAAKSGIAALLMIMTLLINLLADCIGVYCRRRKN